MRLASPAFTPTVLVLLACACTVENAADSTPKSGKSTGGSAPAEDGKAGSPANSTSGGSSGNFGMGGDAIAPGGSNSAVGDPTSGGNSSAGSGPTAGGSTFAGSRPASGGSTFAGSGPTSGGSNVAGISAISGGPHSAGNGPSAGSSNIAGSGNGTNPGTLALGGAAGAGTIGASGSAGTLGAPRALPPTTFLFERKVANGRDHLVAMDFVTREQRIVTTLAEGSVEGWNIDGVTISPDRTRVVLASLYGATAADIATGLSTNRLWNLDASGGDFRRLTPVFPNTHAGQPNWRIDVRDPAFSPDGQYIVFDYGEGDFTGGYVAPWVTAADGSTLPSLIHTDLDCSVNGNAAFNPVTGDLLLEHAVCIGGKNGGFYSYPNNGGSPDYLVNEVGISISSEPPAFSADGSIFVYTGRTYSDNIQSLYAYIVSERRVVPLVSGAVGTDIVNASFAPDNMHMVYCVRIGDAFDLRLLDFSVNPATDTALTDDGISCDAVF